MTGVPLAQASGITIPKGSCQRIGMSTALASASSCAFLRPLTLPANRTVRLNDGRQPPAIVTGRLDRRATRIASRHPFTLWSLPRKRRLSCFFGWKMYSLRSTPL